MSSLFERHLVVFSAIVLDGQSYQIGFFVTTGKITQVLAKKGNILNVNSALVTQISELNHQTFQGGSICLVEEDEVRISKMKNFLKFKIENF